ncbi:MAG: hypothetical protein JNM25_13890 [Planctomycetes bacterium]|nr:hypothetical protein [Planctomycetota bacterium]
MRFSPLGACILLALSIAAQDPTIQDDAHSPKTALAALQAKSGNQWVVQWHPATGTPSAIYGPGLPLADWRQNTLEEARRHAGLLLAEHHDLLGIGASAFREEIGARMGRTWSFTFDQFFGGLPVIDGRVDLRIHMKGVVSMLGSRAWPIPADFDLTPAIGDEVATAIAWDALGATPIGLPAPAPRLCIWGDIHAPQASPVFLAWEVAIRSADQQGPFGRSYVDAKTGAVLRFENDRHNCGFPGCTKATHAANVAIRDAVTTVEPAPAATPATTPLLPVVTTVTVMGWTRTGADATSALVNTPLRGIVLNVPGIGLKTTDQNGQFTIDIASQVTISVNGLDGIHHALINGPNAPTGSFVVDPGVNATIQLLTSGATTNEAAHTTTAYWVDKTNEWARSILGNTAQLNTADNIAANVNVASTCNASYGGNTLNFYNAGGGCANTAFSTVIAHEWGHGLDDRYGGISNTSTDGLSEGWGDIIGLYLVDSPNLGLGFQSPGVPLRSGNNTKLYGTQSEVHNAGEIWMGFAWKYRENLRAAFGTPTAIAVSNDTVIGSIVADATNQADAVREVFIADDDDGNLLNGTPHYAQLSAAAIAKNMPYPELVLANFFHSPLTATTQRLTPRDCQVTVVPLIGTVSQMKLVFNTGGGSTIRSMHPNGSANGYRALLPGRDAGAVNYHFEALMSGGGTARYPSAGELSYVVDAGGSLPFVSVFSDGFETGGAGWTSAQVLAQNDWQLGDPAGKSGTSGGIAWADPQLAATGGNCYGNDLGNTIGTTTWNGAYAANVENYLRAPVINCTGLSGVRLRFKRWLTVEDATYDQARLFVNGVLIWQNPTGAALVDTSWQQVDYAIPNADNNPFVQIEWRLKSDGSVQLGGWNIDDVEVGTQVVPPLDARLTLLPEQGVQNGLTVLRVETQQPNWPWVIGIATTPGPTTVPGFPTFALGGTIGTGSGVTDGTGLFTVGFLASPVPSALGTLVYTQVMTVDATLTNYVVSNPFVNFWTQTP